MNLGYMYYVTKCMFSRGMMSFLIFIRPLLISLILFLASPYSEDKIFQFVFINGVYTSVWGGQIFSTLSDVQRDKNVGIFQNIYISPTSSYSYLFSRMAANFVVLLISILVTYASTCALTFSIGSVGALDLGLIVLNCFMISLFSLALSPFLAISKNGNLLMNTINSPVFILGAIGFSAGLLPNQMIPVVFITPFGYLGEYTRYIAGISSVAPTSFQETLAYPAIGLLIILILFIAGEVIMSSKISKHGVLKT